MAIEGGAGDNCGVELLWDIGWDNTEQDVSVSLAANVWLVTASGAGADVATTLAVLLDVMIADVYDMVVFVFEAAANCAARFSAENKDWSRCILNIKFLIRH